MTRTCCLVIWSPLLYLWSFVPRVIANYGAHVVFIQFVESLTNCGTAQDVGSTANWWQRTEMWESPKILASSADVRAAGSRVRSRPAPCYIARRRTSPVFLESAVSSALAAATSWNRRREAACSASRCTLRASRFGPTTVPSVPA
jgi:hypothetical protein